MEKLPTEFGPIAVASALPRRSRQARVVWGSRVVTVGGDAPVRVQSMTNTDTVDAIGTAIQVKDAAGAVVLQRNLAAEESVSVSAPAPLAVVIGRADATEVVVRGKPFDLAGVSRENVARFEVK